MALERIMQTLQQEKDRLTRELSAVVKMIRAAGKGAQAAVQEYGQRVSRGAGNGGRKQGSRARTVLKSRVSSLKRRKRKMSAQARQNIRVAQQKRREREQAEAKSVTASKKSRRGRSTKSQATP